MSKKIGYIRVSTVDQNPERQLSGMKFDKTYTDFASGSNTNRPQLQIMLDFVREDDEIYVHSMDRLARNSKDMLDLIDNLHKRKVSIFFVRENIRISGEDNAMNKFILMIFSAIAELDLARIRENQAEGIAKAKNAGKYRGRKSKFNAEMHTNILYLMKTRESKLKIARNLGISPHTLYKYLKRINTQEAKSA